MQISPPPASSIDDEDMLSCLLDEDLLNSSLFLLLTIRLGVLLDSFVGLFSGFVSPGRYFSSSHPAI